MVIRIKNDPASALIIGLSAAGTAIGAKAIVDGTRKSKPVQLPKPQSSLAPTVGEDTELKPGQKVNLINTSPQGVLEPATTKRQTLLGN